MPEIDLVIEKIDGRDVIKPAEPIPKGAKNVVYHLPTMKVTFEMKWKRKPNKRKENKKKKNKKRERSRLLNEAVLSPR